MKQTCGLWMEGVVDLSKLYMHGRGKGVTRAKGSDPLRASYHLSCQNIFKPNPNYFTEAKLRIVFFFSLHLQNGIYFLFSFSTFAPCSDNKCFQITDYWN